MFTSTCFAVFFVFFITGSLQACKVGDDYSSESVVNNVGGKWYLNVALEATCSGSINRYKVKFYDDNLVDGRTYDSTLAVWRPINATTYEIDSSTIQQYSYEHNDKRRRKRGVITESTPTFSPAVGVRKGSVIGVYLDNSNPLPVIGNKPGETDINGKPIGGCVTTTSSSTTILTCTGSNQPSYVIHAEADINIVTCNALPTVSNAMYSQLDGDTQYGARVQYNCSTGYIINGNDTISCQLDKSWSLPTPSCSIVNCSNPGEPANGYTNDNVFIYQSTVQYYCNVGHQLSGDSSIECTANGNWNNTLPNCVIINCTDPGMPANGTRNGMDFYYNSTVSYSCNTGYNLTGAASITCNATGQWNAPVPSCPPVNCGNPDTPNNGNKNGSAYTYTSIVSFQCNSGHFLSGPVSLICLSNGSWNDTAPTCNPVNCTDPGTPTNGTRNGTVFTFNSTVLYSCDTGYTITGATSLTCLSTGLWDAPVPSCDIVNCSNPGEPTNGILQGGTFTYNSVVTYNCSVGYNLTGAVALTCLSDGTWSAPVPSCPPVNCSDPGIPTNGSKSGSVYTYSSVVSYQCISGYSISGADTLSCLSTGSWNGSVPYCYPDCIDPGDPSNGQRAGDTFNYNSVLSYTCNTGYNLTGESSIICLSNGSWSNMIPSCTIVNCSDPGTPTNGERSGDIFTYNAEVVYSCDDEYSLVGSQAIRCQPNGYWSDTLPSCAYIDCPDPGIPDNGLRTGSNFSFNSSVNFTCYPGYQLTGSDVITCSTEGKWSEDTPSCNITYCSGPMSPANGNVSYTSLSVNSSVYFTCNTGYTLTGNTNITCLPNTQWSNVIPTCTITVCPLTPPSHGYFTPNNNQYNYGSIVSVNCNPGYGLVGVSTLTCTATGQWSNNIPLCIAIARSTSSVTNSQEFTSTQQSLLSSTINSNSYSKLSSIESTISITGSTVRSTPSNNASAALGIGVGIGSTVILLVLILLILFVLIVFIVKLKKRATKNNSYYEGIAISSTGNYVLATEILNDVIASSNEDFSMSTNEAYSEVKGRSSVFNMSNNESYMKKEDIRVPFYEPANDRIKIIAQIRKSKSVLIQFDSLRLTSSLGSGQFGNVCKGQWKKPNGDTIDVAVKMLQDGASEQEKIKFLQEAAIMSQFTHANVIKLHGVVSDDEHPMIAIEYMPKGDLDHFLQKMITNPGELVHHNTPALLLSFCQQVCLGMTYLSSKGFVHRDLAARNILVSADNICKIIDFGLSRDLEDENYYVSHQGAIIPVKWTAPEALNYRKYSTASDVWSYGCLMYEIWSIGHKPFEEDTNASALRKITSSERLPPPPGCPEAIYSLMISCWRPVASERPNFHEIMVSLLQPNKNILTIPESALSSHPQAGSLGGTLKAGENMYPEIQHCYSDTMDTAL